MKKLTCTTLAILMLTTTGVQAADSCKYSIQTFNNTRNICKILGVHICKSDDCELNNKTEATTQAKPVTEATTQAVTEVTTEVTTHTSTEVTTQTRPTVTTEPQTETTTLSMTNNTYAQQVLNLVNRERAKYNLSPLTLSSSLNKVANAKAEDMLSNNYFSHTSPTYGTPFEMLKSFGISYNRAGENIAKGQKSPEAVVNAWMNSEGHRANILSSSFNQLGVGYVKGSSTYWVQIFID